MSLRLCRSEKVKNPYYVSFLGVHLYSSQELAYVIYHYPLLVMDHLVDDRLLDFLREELNLGFLALKLENWRKSGEDPDEMLMFLLQESDYYSANEISEYRQTLSSYRKQPAAQIKKLRGMPYLACASMERRLSCIRKFWIIRRKRRQKNSSQRRSGITWGPAMVVCSCLIRRRRPLRKPTTGVAAGTACEAFTGLKSSTAA